MFPGKSAISRIKIQNMTLVPPHILAQLNRLKADGAWRSLKRPPVGLVDFCSNDYLGLGQQIPSMKQESQASGGSRLLAGNHAAHEDFEAYAATLFRSPQALLFNSGYMANLAVLSSLATRQDTWLYDERVHASLKDGLRLSPAKRFSFRHNDLSDLERLLKKTSGTRFVLTEGLFSMDGDLPDLQGLVELGRKHGAYMILDEAHSTGLYGPGGAGIASALGLETDFLVRVHTFGKAAGWHGSIVACPESIRDYLVNQARPFIYTTAMPPLEATRLHRQVERMAQADSQRSRLVELQEFFHKEANAIGLNVPDRLSPIVPVLCPGNAKVMALAGRVQESGFYVRPILAPTVAPGTERLRVVLRSLHSKAELKGLVQAIAKGLET